MRAGIANFVLAVALAATSVAGSAAPKTITFEETPVPPGIAEVGQFLGVVYERQLPKQNVGFEEFFWAWNGSGVVVPDGPATQGFLLGLRGGDFDFVSCAQPTNCDSKFAYFQARPAAYITTMDQSFSFQGGVFSATVPGTLTIVGQRSGPGIGGGTYEDVGGATGTVTFDGQNNPGALEISKFQDKYLDRLVITSSTASGQVFQWALDDFVYAPVPEPGTWAMFGLGVLGVGFAVKRRKPRIR